MVKKKNFKQQRTKTRTKNLVFAALMTALSVIIGFVCKNYFTFGAIRITFENLPILLTGILLGPVYGGAAGAAADLVTAPSTGSVNPIITLGAASIGIISGILGNYVFRKKNLPSVLASVLPAHVVGSMLIKSFGLWYFYGYAIQLCIMRIPLYFVIAVAESYLIYIITKNRRLDGMFRTERKSK